jgi:hypothetical protein
VGDFLPCKLHLFQQTREILPQSWLHLPCGINTDSSLTLSETNDVLRMSYLEIFSRLIESKAESASTFHTVQK